MHLCMDTAYGAVGYKPMPHVTSANENKDRSKFLHSLLTFEELVKNLNLSCTMGHSGEYGTTKHGCGGAVQLQR